MKTIFWTNYYILLGNVVTTKLRQTFFLLGYTKILWKMMLWQKNDIKQILFKKFVHREKNDFVTKNFNTFFLEMTLTMDEVYFRQPFAICQCFFLIFFLNDLAVFIIYEPQNYRPYLGLRNMYILSTFDQDISLNWEYYPKQCPILLSTVYWDNGAGWKVNDTRVQSCISFI